MAQHQDAASNRSNSSDHPFPFQHEDPHTHPTLLPNGILNDEDDEVVPWPRRSSRAEYTEQSSVLRVRRLPQDMTTREFAALFTFAEGYLGSDLVVDGNERLGIARFTNYLSAERAMHKMTSVNTGPYTQLSFEILNKRASQDMLAPPAAMSSSLKSNGSNSSMPQISRLSSYVKDKNLEQQNIHNDFYGSSSLPKSSIMNGSMTSNYSSNGGTLWSPTSPRFPADLSKSPPSGLSMLPPSIDEDAWNRTGQIPSMVGNRYSQQLSINTTMASQDNRMTPLQSPSLSTHGVPSSGYPNMDGSGNGHGLSRSNYIVGSPSANFPASPPKHYVTATQVNGTGYNHQANYSARMGPPTPVNTNPADQNPPCNTLYVGNLPLATTEEELKSLFSRQPGYRRLCYRTKSNGPMCFVEFEDVHYAINSLKLLQGVILSSSIKGGIRLSFSKNPLGVRKMDSNQMLSHQPNHVVVQQTPSSYNGMHAPPGLQPDQIHNAAQSQHAINPIWR